MTLFFSRSIRLERCFLVILDDVLDGLIECDQQRYIAADDFGQDSGCGADLCFAAAVGDQTGENLGSDVPLFFREIALYTTVIHRRQTMSKRVLVAWWARFAA